MTFTVCRFCSYNPCMCGQRDYGTEHENRRRDAEEADKRWEEDKWALPNYPGEGSDEDG